jgi:archaemetzincin
VSILGEAVHDETGLETTVLELVLDPRGAYDASRAQYESRRLLAMLREIAGLRGSLVLGVTDVDLFSPIFTFVLGEAHLGGSAGIISLYRLRTSFYGLPEDEDLLVARAVREALHETGHMLGLAHCRDPRCVMRFSATAEEVDLKPAAYCPACLPQARGEVGPA